MSTLFVVATPIGNLEDITLRALRILGEVELILAEDTRQTKKLLNKYEIKTPLSSYHKFNIKSKTEYLVDQIKQGKIMALVSYSGMPAISDPGYELIRESAAQGIQVEVIPGPSASLTALVASGLPTDEFIFKGFLPKKPGKRRKALEKLQNFAGSIIIYESPYRVVKTLGDIEQVLGSRQVAVCRELTKKFEEIIRGKVGDIIERLKDKKVKGEVVLVVEGSR
ncbi:MAG: 16S rRNA (cytidine(1402)-2'-O)-methyltransferase [Candidatus Margulisbacteria bacterium]|nr:16S rRNA (cytidine(1402)-2'-O)-methyltransferase [Candidatus Margulisiibacteriota bacterium]